MIKKHKFLTMGVTILTVAALLAGCGAQKGAQKGAVSVNTYKVEAEDTQMTSLQDQYLYYLLTLL